MTDEFWGRYSARRRFKHVCNECLAKSINPARFQKDDSKTHRKDVMGRFKRHPLDDVMMQWGRMGA
jgi:hypothetical protein